jgi:hypothetical protein
LYKAIKVNDKWASVTALPFNDKSSTGNPSIDASEQLYILLQICQVLLVVLIFGKLVLTQMAPMDYLKTWSRYKYRIR